MHQKQANNQINLSISHRGPATFCYSSLNFIAGNWKSNLKRIWIDVADYGLDDLNEWPFQCHSGPPFLHSGIHSSSMISIRSVSKIPSSFKLFRSNKIRHLICLCPMCPWDRYIWCICDASNKLNYWLNFVAWDDKCIRQCEVVSLKFVHGIHTHTRTLLCFTEYWRMPRYKEKHITIT